MPTYVCTVYVIPIRSPSFAMAITIACKNQQIKWRIFSKFITGRNTLLAAEFTFLLYHRQRAHLVIIFSWPDFSSSLCACVHENPRTIRMCSSESRNSNGDRVRGVCLPLPSTEGRPQLCLTILGVYICPVPASGGIHILRTWKQLNMQWFSDDGPLVVMGNLNAHLGS